MTMCNLVASCLLHTAFSTLLGQVMDCSFTFVLSPSPDQMGGGVQRGRWCMCSKKNGRMSENSSVPCTENAIRRKEVNTEVEKVAVRHGLGSTAITTLMLRRVGGVRGMQVWSFQSYRAANAFSGDALWLHHPGKYPPQQTISPSGAER